jgi:hypothetical protein
LPKLSEEGIHVLIHPNWEDGSTGQYALRAPRTYLQRATGVCVDFDEFGLPGPMENHTYEHADGTRLNERQQAPAQRGSR